jgi:hypothetical protein
MYNTRMWTIRGYLTVGLRNIPVSAKYTHFTQDYLEYRMDSTMLNQAYSVFTPVDIFSAERSEAVAVLKVGLPMAVSPPALT